MVQRKEQSIEQNKIIAKNTTLLYVRMILTMCVQLYTVPIILNNLGVSDYGLYNVIGGVVLMFTFLGGSMGSGAQRFIAFALGRNDESQLSDVFDTTNTIFIGFSIIAIVVVEVIGYWFVNYRMNIPFNRMVAANWVFQLSLLTFVVNLISTPYNAAIIAHERVSIYAYISIFECISKLGLAYTLSFIEFDKLIFYAIAVFLIAVVVRIFYHVYCRQTFSECKQIRLKFNRDVGIKLLSYSGWNLFGVIALLGRGQGINIIINLFFGTLLNAAHAISMQINGVVTQFINNIYTATRPPITKLYANGDITGMWRLVFSSSKFAFYLLMIISVPALIEIPYILDIWLGEVPPLTTKIVVIMIVITLIETLVNQLVAAFQAANKIKRYQQYSSTIILLSLPLSYVWLKYIYISPLIPYVIMVSLSILYVLSMVLVAYKELQMDIRYYVKAVLLNNIIVYAIVFFSCYVLSLLFEPSILRLLTTVVSTLVFSAFAIWFIGMKIDERRSAKKIIQGFISKHF